MVASELRDYSIEVLSSKKVSINPELPFYRFAFKDKINK
jgi:hypothetical protein